MVVKVKDLKIDDEYATIEPKASIQQAAGIIKDRNIAYLIATTDNKALGLLSDRDIIEKVVAEGKNVQQTTVEEVMSKVVQVTEEESVDYCLEKLAEHKLPALPVVDEKKELIGVVTLTDCLGTGTLFDLSENNLV